MILWPHLILSTQLPLHSYYIFWHSTKLRWTKNERARHISWGHIVSLTFYPYPITIFGTPPLFYNSDSAFSDIFTTLDSNVKITPTLLTLTYYNFGLRHFNDLDMWPFRLLTTSELNSDSNSNSEFRTPTSDQFPTTSRLRPSYNPWTKKKIKYPSNWVPFL